MSYQSHEALSAGFTPRCGVITLSDTRSAATDTSGRAIVDMLKDAGADVKEIRLIPDEPATLRSVLSEWLTREDLDIILTNGGTGIAQRDQTIDVIESIIETPLPGFGELFRMLSWEQIGAGAMLSRAAGGVAHRKLLFAMPGSTAAVELAMSRLIIPGMKHLLRELRR